MSLLSQKMLVSMPCIHSYGKNSAGVICASLNGGGLGGLGSVVYPSANMAIYIPFRLTAASILTQLWWANGATVSGNVDMGIYTEDGTRIVSTGSTAQTGTSTLQAVDITDIILDIGTFYFGFVMDNTTGTIIRGSAGVALLCPLAGIAEQATAFPLPASATFASATNNYVPYCGALLNPRTVI